MAYTEHESLAYLVEVVVLTNQLFKLGLHVDNLLGREIKLHNWHSRFLEILQEPNFRRLQEHQAAALAVGTTRGTSDSVNVVAGVIRRVELDDPVNSGNLDHVRRLKKKKEFCRERKHTSKPLAATSVQMRTPCLALQNSKKVLVRFCCFCFPCRSRTGRSM